MYVNSKIEDVHAAKLTMSFSVYLETSVPFGHTLNVSLTKALRYGICRVAIQ